MNVSVNLGEPLWREVGWKELALVVPADSTIDDLQRILAHHYPELAAYLIGGDLSPTAIT